MKKPIIIRAISLGIITALFAGCGVLTTEDRRVEYKKSKIANPLELPPDLNANLEDELVIPGADKDALYSDYLQDKASDTPESRKSRILPQQVGVTLKRTEGQYWLQVAQPVDKVWGQVRDFWLDSGFRLHMENANIGVMETQWNENRGDIPQDIIRQTLGKVTDFLWSAGTQDRFRMRLERADNNQSEVYITHRGMKEVSKGEDFVWQTRPSDPELEKEMLKRLMVYLGNTEAEARRQITDLASDKAKVQRRDDHILLLTSFPLAWQHTGRALDRAGFTLMDKDREQGIFFIRQLPQQKATEEKGFFSSLAFWKNKQKAKIEEINLKLKSSAAGTVLKVEPAKQDSNITPELKEMVLDLLYQQLK